MAGLARSREERRAQRQLALCLVAVLLLNAPALAVVDRLAVAASLPATPIYIFIAWLAVILAAAINLARR